MHYFGSTHLAIFLRMYTGTSLFTGKLILSLKCKSIDHSICDSIWASCELECTFVYGFL